MKEKKETETRPRVTTSIHYDDTQIWTAEQNTPTEFYDHPISKIFTRWPTILLRFETLQISYKMTTYFLSYKK
jgi:hypothetical protein